VIRLFLVLLLLVAASIGRAQQDDRARTEALARSTSDRLKALNQEADRLASEARTLLGDLRKLELERQIKVEELRQARSDEERVAAELGTLNQELGRLESEEQAERPALRARLVELYKLGNGGYVRLLLSTSEARSLGQASRMVATIARRDRDRMAAHQRRVSELKQTGVALEERRAQLAASRAAAERAQAGAAAALQKHEALISDIDRRRDLNAQLAGELLTTQQRLQATLRDLPAGSASTPSAPPMVPFATRRGELDWPAAGPLRHGFGHSVAAAGSSPNGIEITTQVGTPVRVVHDGTVAFADTFAGYGKLVIVQHGAEHGEQAFSLYGHLLDISVARGARVSRADPVGTAGFALLGVPGLYFELRVDGQPVDPLQWLKKR
jgi:septal ring factor EnvC (AmiA/AmiB activator)